MTIVIFDLDGTISDPAEGITRSINHALVGLGFQPRPTEELLKYIGPHLSITFSELTGRSDEITLSRGIELYRERYIPIGFKENRLYEGMREVLEELSVAGCELFVATTKRRDIALKVLNFLGIRTSSARFTDVTFTDPRKTFCGIYWTTKLGLEFLRL